MQTESKLAAWKEKRRVKREKQKEKEKNKTLGQKIWGWVWSVLVAFVAAMLVRIYIGEPVRVDGYSMTNTLQDGEIVWVSKLSYRGREPERNDVVICRYPGRVNEGGGQITLNATLSLNRYTLFVKRLVALPGDTVQISGGHLYVNGELVADPPLMGSVPRDYPLRQLGADEYFVMGDNRFSSHDSRADDVGPISRDAIMGKVKSVILPFSNRRSVEE